MRLNYISAPGFSPCFNGFSLYIFALLLSSRLCDVLFIQVCHSLQSYVACLPLELSFFDQRKESRMFLGVHDCHRISHCISLFEFLYTHIYISALILTACVCVCTVFC